MLSAISLSQDQKYKTGTNIHECFLNAKVYFGNCGDANHRHFFEEGNEANKAKTRQHKTVKLGSVKLGSGFQVAKLKVFQTSNLGSLTPVPAGLA
jgi:hypothetical protein